MAITRCPYCHAIIDEADKYCNNCGTQLLFTEDEEVEEEIPGEKIIDAEVEEKDYTVDEPESEKRQRPAPAKDLDAEIGEDLEEDLPEGTGKTAIAELMAGADLDDEEAELEGDEEVILVDEIKSSEAGDKAPEPEAPAAAKPAGTGEEEQEPGSEDELLEEETEEDEDLEDEELEAEEKAEAAAEDEEKEKSGDDEEAGEEELADELEEDLEDEIEEAPVKAPLAAPRGEEETREYGRPIVPPAAAEPEAAQEEPEPAIYAPDEPELDSIENPDIPNESATAGEASLRPATFDSQELENLGRTVELSRERIDKFIEVMASKTSETAAGPAGPPAEPASEPEVVERETVAPEPASKAVGPDLEPGPGKTPEPPTGTLPPWASTMKGAPVFPDEASASGPSRAKGGPGAPGPDEVEIFPRRRGTDSTMGLPERIAQAPLPFERPGTEEELESDEAETSGAVAAEEGWPGPEGAEEDEEAGAPSPEPGPALESPIRDAAESVLPSRDAGPGRIEEAVTLPGPEPEEAAPRPPFSLAVFFKSKVFDLLFVGLFWLVALWLAASSTGVTLFDILGAMSSSMLLLYAAFVALYFFLFKFFLGETLGDRLFRPRERE